MGHLSERELRHAVDEPLALDGRQRQHLTACPRCTAHLATIRADAEFAAHLLRVPAEPVDTRRAFCAVQTRLADGPPARRSMTPGGLTLRRRSGLSAWLGGLAAAVVAATAVAFTPAGSLAQSFIDLFQPSQVAPVGVTTADVKSLAQLRHYGRVSLPTAPGSNDEPSLAAAAADAGMTVLTPSTLPAGVPSRVSYTEVSGATASFTFSAAKARAWATARGKTLPDMPGGLNGSTLSVKTGNGVIAVYGGTGSLPGLIVGQMRAPQVTTTGASVETMENYILNLPGVSPRLAAEVRALGDPKTILPLPIPVDMAQGSPVTVRGVQGVAVGDNTGLGSAVIWEQDGIVYGVGGAMSRNEALQIANGLH